MMSKGKDRQRFSVSFEKREASLLRHQAQKRRLTIADMVREAVKEWGFARYRVGK